MHPGVQRHVKLAKSTAHFWLDRWNA